MASEFPSMPREYYGAAAEAGRLRQEIRGGAGGCGAGMGKKKRRTKEKEEPSSSSEKEKEKSNVELVDNATIRHLLHRHEPPALDLGPVAVLGYSPESGLWAVGKPPGMPVHAAGGYRKNTVCGVLEAAARAAGRGPPPGACSGSSPPPTSASSSSPSVLPWPVYLHPLHRLDKPVSGVLLFAESAAAAERVRAQLAAERGSGGSGGSGVRKVYIARVRGVFPSRRSELSTEEMRRSAVSVADDDDDDEEDEGGGKKEREKGFTLDVALGWDAAAHRAECFPAGPKYLSSSRDPPPSVPALPGRAKGAPRTAATSFALLSTAADGLTSLVECRPLSGRTHQIRAHLGFLGHPIANDALYYETGDDYAVLYPGPERPRLEAHGGERGAGEGGAGCRPAASSAGNGGGEKSSMSSSSNSDYISATDVAEILDQCGWVVGEAGGGGAAAAKSAEADKEEEENASKASSSWSPLEADALSACPFCPSLARPAAASELRPLWLHARAYSGPGWAFECPAPRWASEGFVPRRTSGL